MNQKIIIRNAKKSDVIQVYSFITILENENFDYNSFQKIFETNLQNPDYAYFVATLNNNIVGFASFHSQNLLHHCGRVGEIQELYVSNDYRNKGIARMLLNEIEKFAKLKEIKNLEVTSNKKRKENVIIYKKLGFILSHNKFTKEHF
jgi:(aminoalkyl)phosphonate N-acetyltransferase